MNRNKKIYVHVHVCLYMYRNLLETFIKKLPTVVLYLEHCSGNMSEELLLTHFKLSCGVFIFHKHIILLYHNYFCKKVNDIVLPKIMSGTGSRIILETQVHTFQTLTIH